MPEASDLTAGPPLSVVLVPADEDPAALGSLLASVLAECADAGVEVIVVAPNPSSTPGARFIECVPSATIAERREIGTEAAAGRLVALIDQLTPMPNQWLDTLVSRTRRDPAIPTERSGADALTDEAEPDRDSGPGQRPRERLAPGRHVVICGAGPAGLTAALLLARQGHRVTVLEGDEVVGGISRTATYKGFRFDIGGHRFFTKIPAVQALWEELLGDQFIDVPRLSRIHYQGKYFDYPLKAGNALSGLGVWEAGRILLSYVQAHLRPNPLEETFEQWVSNRFGRRLYQLFFKTYTEKVWGIPCTEIRAEWAAQRIRGLSLARAIVSATPLNRRTADIKTLIHEFKYPRLGPGQMWETCRDRVVALGGEVRLQNHVVGLDLDEGRAVVVRARTPRGETRIEADHVISTIPLRTLVRALGSAAPDAVIRAAEGLRYRDFVLVALVLDRARLFPDNWIYIHTPGVQVGRIQNFNNWSAAMVPDSSKTCLGMEYFCFKGDGIWESSDDALVALAARELEVLRLAPGARVVDGTVVRMPKAYPIYDATYRAHVDVIRGFIDSIPNLQTVGRNGMHKYNNQDHSMYTAMLAVENLDGATHDLWAVNSDFEYHEEQRVERAATPAEV